MARPNPPYDLDEATAHLRQVDPRLARAIDRIGPCGLDRGRSSPFAALLRSIIFQQLAGAAASTIHGRVLALLPSGPPRPQHFAALSDEELRGAGLSRNKLAAIRDLAERSGRGEIPQRSRMARWSDERIVERLTEVRGVGRWTVEMLLIFELGRPDVLPLDDLGVRKGFSRVFGGELPEKDELAARGERWRPYRSVASWYLWRACELPTRRRRTAS